MWEVAPIKKNPKLEFVKDWLQEKKMNSYFYDVNALTETIDACKIRVL